jgi:hypothetical protein
MFRLVGFTSDGAQKEPQTYGESENQYDEHIDDIRIVKCYGVPGDRRSKRNVMDRDGIPRFKLVETGFAGWAIPDILLT